MSDPEDVAVIDGQQDALELIEEGGQLEDP